MRARASASATREVSIVIQRRPHCSATVGGGAGTAGRVEHEVAGVGGHQEAALNHLRVGLNDIDLVVAKAADASVVPNVCNRHDRKVVEEIACSASVFADGMSRSALPSRSMPVWCRFPMLRSLDE